MSPMQLEQLRTQARSIKEKVAQLEADLTGQRLELTKVEGKITALVKPPGPKVVETKKRSLVKALGWRLTAGVVTFCTSYYFTRSLASAGAIVGSDFLSKAGTMYFGERLFSKVSVGKSASGAESPMRSVAKALIWRAFAFCQTMIVSIIFLKEASTGAKIAGADTVIKTTLMVLYDQAWAKVQWGRELENLGGDGI